MQWSVKARSITIAESSEQKMYYIQTLDDLALNQLGSVETVGITAGASTPNNIIEEDQKKWRKYYMSSE